MVLNIPTHHGEKLYGENTGYTVPNEHIKHRSKKIRQHPPLHLDIYKILKSKARSHFYIFSSPTPFPVSKSPGEQQFIVFPGKVESKELPNDNSPPFGDSWGGGDVCDILDIDKASLHGALMLSL